MTVHKRLRNEFLTTNWSGGKTEEIFIYPEGANYAARDFSLRISTATVEQETSEFTKLPGVQRIITPLSGDIHLFEKKTDGTKKPLVSLKPYELYSFCGDLSIVSVGQCRDFNVMTKGNGKAELFVIRAGTTRELKTPDAKSFVFIFGFNASGDLLINNQKIPLHEFEFIRLSEIDKNISIINHASGTVLAGFYSPCCNS